MLFLFLPIVNQNQYVMQRLVFILTSIFVMVGSHCFAQKKHKKGNEFKMPTQVQQDQYKEYLKRVLKDSINLPLEKRDTVAAIELQTILKKMKLGSDKTLSKDDKDVQNGMLDDDMYMRLGAVLSVDEIQRMKDFDRRQKAAADAAEKERKDAENQRNSQSGMGGYGGRPYGYGGYGGYY